MGTGASTVGAETSGDKQPLIQQQASVQTDDWLLEAALARIQLQAGTGALSDGLVQVAAGPSIEETWHNVCQTLDVPEGAASENNNLVVKRTGWKTVRIFVSSTFRDFHSERELLVKEVC